MLRAFLAMNYLVWRANEFMFASQQAVDAACTSTGAGSMMKSLTWSSALVQQTPPVAPSGRLWDSYRCSDVSARACEVAMQGSDLVLCHDTASLATSLNQLRPSLVHTHLHMVSS